MLYYTISVHDFNQELIQELHRVQWIMSSVLVFPWGSMRNVLATYFDLVNSIDPEPKLIWVVRELKSLFFTIDFIPMLSQLINRLEILQGVNRRENDATSRNIKITWLISECLTSNTSTDSNFLPGQSYNVLIAF